jgi:predicted RNA-binding protein with PUA-like domain
MANRWLLKTDPDDYTYDDLERDGRAVWDGVANNLALQNIRKIKQGDALIIYHTGDEKAIVGLAEAASNPYPDPGQNNEKLAVIAVKPKRRAQAVVTLAAIKAVPELATFPLVRLPRLSVMPITEAEWRRLRQMAGW